MWIQLSQKDGNPIDIIYASDYISINDECFFIEDTEIMTRIEDMVMRFDKKSMDK